MRDRRVELVDHSTWSLYLGLVSVLGAVVIAALPPTHLLRELDLPRQGADLASFFAGALIIVYGIIAVNLGAGVAAVAVTVAGQRCYLYLCLRLFLGLAMTGPFWVIFAGFYLTSPHALLLGGIYALGYGLALGLYGIALGTVSSEIKRFLLKYGGLIIYLAGTLPLPVANPLASMTAILQERFRLVETGSSLLILIGLVGLTMLFARRRLGSWGTEVKDIF